ncbi:hypothetical protein ACIQV3_26225 [Streptomyces sp. NPDC099050]|uniref:hypothetical protein n=1 Tax=Streptomyces sp. NPDC099050 TaxID=3366100 RepID=UPI00380352C1
MKALWWTLAVVGTVAAVTSLVWVTAGDLERSSQVWGVVGAVAGVGALVVGLLQLRASAAAAAAAAAAVPVPSVRADGGAIAAGGNVSNAQARDTAPSAGGTPAPGTGPGISATGGSIAAGGDVDGSTAQRGA